MPFFTSVRATPGAKRGLVASAAATTHTLVLSRTSRASHRLLERDHCIHHTMQSVRNTASCMFQAVEASDKCNSSFCTEASALRGKCRNQEIYNGVVQVSHVCRKRQCHGPDHVPCLFHSDSRTEKPVCDAVKFNGLAALNESCFPAVDVS